MERKFAFCRPLKNYYCVECCKRQGPQCPILGELPDGTEGCLAYYKKTPDNIPKTDFCEKFVCFKELVLRDENTEKILEDVRKELSKRTPGRFNLKEIFTVINYPSAKTEKS
jgi:hypothetical protein